ncbi:hypothetical protein [Salinimicrobium flavum]|uniref:Uncharacterized protein n=1 Tax=Salinimicrobium flavum TaxID=1737065 RepID=A0ABW5IWX5_9FLAO
MKNLILHLFAIFTPAVLLAVTWKLMIPEVALALLFAYVFVYRTWLDGSRLYQKGLIPKRDIWKIVYNGDRANHFKELYLRK